jgi:hypothetical protein
MPGGVAEFVRVCPLIVGVQWTTRRWLLWTAGMIRVDPGEPAFYFGEQAQQLLVVRSVFVVHALHRTALRRTFTN